MEQILHMEESPAKKHSELGLGCEDASPTWKEFEGVSGELTDTWSGALAGTDTQAMLQDAVGSA